MLKTLLAAFPIALALALAGATPLGAVPPPPEQVVADCDDPTYASDVLVCADPALLALDRRAAELAADEEPGRGEQLGWFRASRMCAFEADHAACLEAAYCARIALLDRAGAGWPAACAVEPDDFVPAQEISRNGFARSERVARRLSGAESALSGFVDHGNLYGDEDARQVLGEWWGGPGPDADHWRFDLKARADDPAGRSFAVVVPNGPVRDGLLALFRADAEAGRPTQVYLRGVVTTFAAPANTARATGLRVAVASAADIRVAPGPGSE